MTPSRRTFLHAKIHALQATSRTRSATVQFDQSRDGASRGTAIRPAIAPSPGWRWQIVFVMAPSIHGTFSAKGRAQRSWLDAPWRRSVCGGLPLVSATALSLATLASDYVAVFLHAAAFSLAQVLAWLPFVAAARLWEDYRRNHRGSIHNTRVVGRLEQRPSAVSRTRPSSAMHRNLATPSGEFKSRPATAQCCHDLLARGNVACREGRKIVFCRDIRLEPARLPVPACRLIATAGQFVRHQRDQAIR
ncbi:hypothetical protein SAMN04488020_10535 [Palleronia marisminoris]|uniref:Uncharacterized protein n=1 Tax=Palleronia marisminoris TaxID=315423 RepID=A0A1Y5SQA5_9RHOB|nr:hypothetical protein SAMN04488020_10535 [Palleronia marisminoris]SLN45693.1 hypothetical protein PAM7066_01980 [Palleronia marisminoris]